MNKPIRVLQIVGNMGAGGLETLIMNWYRTIDREKVQFDFLVHKKKKAFYEDEIVKLGGKIFRCTFLDDHNIFKYRQDLSAFFREHPEYTIVHGHHSSLGSIYLQVAKESKVPIRISHSHTSSYSRTIRGFIKYLCTRGFGKNANYHFACSKVAGDYMYGSSDYTIIKNGIDINRFIYNENTRREYRNILNINNNVVFLHVGRFHDPKNHKYLVDLFDEYHKSHDESVLLLAGVGPLQEIIKEKVNRLGLSQNVVFLDNRNDIESLLCAADVFLFPSLYEGLPLTLVEAQTSGLPVVCSDSITDETKFSPYFYQVNLNDCINKWMHAIDAAIEQKLNRIDGYKLAKKSGFDNMDVCRRIQEFYLTHYKII